MFFSGIIITVWIRHNRINVGKIWSADSAHCVINLFIENDSIFMLSSLHLICRNMISSGKSFSSYMFEFIAEEKSLFMSLVEALLNYMEIFVSWFMKSNMVVYPHQLSYKILFLNIYRFHR